VPVEIQIIIRGEGVQVQKKSCGMKTKERVVEAEEGTEKVHEKDMRYRRFTWGRDDNRDCEIRKETVTLYEDGRYRDIAELHDHGTFSGDTFKVTMKVEVRGDAVAQWGWDRYVPQGADRDNDKSGTDDGIKRNFTRSLQ
jgi:hypothetical protein